jgi:putative hydrolase of HD superfamily
MADQTPDKSRIGRLISFLKELEKLKKIERRNYFPDIDRAENDAEHSWHLTMFLLVFDADLPRELDRLRMVKMALLHDLAEIYAGDTFAFDSSHKKTQEAREALALKKLLSKLPEDLRMEFEHLSSEFQIGATEEAKVVRAFDKIQALHQNLVSGWLTYKTHKIPLQRIREEHKTAMTSSTLMSSIYEVLFEEAKRKGYISP